MPYFSVLESGRLKSRSGKTNAQDALLGQMPSLTYSCCPFIAFLFLLNPSSRQFAFSLLHVDDRQSGILKLEAAAGEFYIIMVWTAAAHFFVYHTLTCLKMLEKILLIAVEELK